MNEKQAEILISINETKNITETARILKLTQPTISFHMKNMEKEYGMTSVSYTHLDVYKRQDYMSADLFLK